MPCHGAELLTPRPSVMPASSASSACADEHDGGHVLEENEQIMENEAEAGFEIVNA